MEFNPMVEMYPELLSEGYFSSKDFYYKFSEWKKGRGTNILMITGFMGGGKSTLSRSLQQSHGAEIYCLDDFESGIDYSSKTIAFYTKYPQYKKGKWLVEDSIDVSETSYRHALMDYIKFLISYADDNPSKLVIIEGIQLYNRTEEAAIYVLRKDYPTIVVGTGVFKTFSNEFSRESERIERKVKAKMEPEKGPIRKTYHLVLTAMLTATYNSYANPQYEWFKKKVKKSDKEFKKISRSITELAEA